MDFPELEPNQRSTCPPERPDSCRWDGLDAVCHLYYCELVCDRVGDPTILGEACVVYAFLKLGLRRQPPNGQRARRCSCLHYDRPRKACNVDNQQVQAEAPENARGPNVVNLLRKIHELCKLRTALWRPILSAGISRPHRRGPSHALTGPSY